MSDSTPAGRPITRGGARPDLPSGLRAELERAVGPAQVLTDPDLAAAYETDWTGRFSAPARAVVRPGSAEEVAGVLRACADAEVPVVVQGGNTGLVGGGVPSDRGEVLLSTTRLTGLGPVDRPARRVTAGAGATLAAVQTVARAAGLDLGVDFASRDSATVGGAVATNAGGERVLRYGSMRAQLAGIEAVLADGSVVGRLDAPAKDNTGYDLAGLVAGSEGTLAVVTRARLRLVPRPAARAVALLAVGGVAQAQAVLAAARGLSGLEAAELFLADGLALVRASTGLRGPFAAAHPAYLLLECTGDADPTDALLDALARTGEVLDAVLATESGDRERLWRYREGHTEAIAALGVPVKVDVALPSDALPGFVDELPGLVAAVVPGGRVVVFGHLAESNLHVNVLVEGVPLAAALADEVTDVLLHRVAALGGSISAEHGIGRAKVRWLGLSRSPAEVAAMRAVKRALDPGGLLGPGVLLP